MRQSAYLSPRIKRQPQDYGGMYVKYYTGEQVNSCSIQVAANTSSRGHRYLCRCPNTTLYTYAGISSCKSFYARTPFSLVVDHWISMVVVYRMFLVENQFEERCHFWAWNTVRHCLEKGSASATQSRPTSRSHPANRIMKSASLYSPDSCGNDPL